MQFDELAHRRRLSVVRPHMSLANQRSQSGHRLQGMGPFGAHRQLVFVVGC